MPTYEFRNRKTGKIVEHQMKMSEYDKFKEDHPELERVIVTAPKLNYASHSQGSVTDIAAKKDGGWKEVLQKIGRANPISEVGDKFHKKGIKEIKTTQVIEKHVKKQEKQRADRAARAK
jgi:hypothetical protein